MVKHGVDGAASEVPPFVLPLGSFFRTLQLELQLFWGTWRKTFQRFQTFHEVEKKYSDGCEGGAGLKTRFI